MDSRTENWMGHSIRFVELAASEWAAVSKDVSDALDYRDANSMTRHINKKYLVYVKLTDMNQKYLALTEFGIYKAIFNSHKPEAESFQEWVFLMLKQLRQSSGLAGFEVFRMLDKEEQRQQMAKLSRSLKHPVRVNFIKANTIANKAVSTRHGYPKMVKKNDMPPEMLVDRQPILQDVVDLMATNERFGLGIHVSDAIYKKYVAGEGA